MKIWIDLTNSPHIQFFKPFIKKWKSEGYEIIITCRNLSNTIQLIKKEGWKYFEVGSHGGKNIFKKVIFHIIRCFKLFIFLRNKNIDLGISHSSFESARVGHFLKIPTIYINDNEHAKANIISFKYATVSILPKFLDEFSSKYKFNRIEFYNGVKEAIYLSKLKFDSNKSNPKYIFVRLEPWSAQYYNQKNSQFVNFLKELSLKFKIIILPRDTFQIKTYKNLNLKNIEILEKPVEIKEVVNSCILFIGAGGSMTRELAILGVPTLSTYKDKLLKVDEYLINKGIMWHSSEPNINLVEEIIENNFTNQADFNKIMSLGNESFSQINKIVNEFKVKE